MSKKSLKDIIAEINDLEEAIENSINIRDYRNAEELQKKLKSAKKDKEAFSKVRSTSNLNKEMKEIDDKQKREEFRLKERMKKKMRRILEEANRKLKQMRKKHQNEIVRLDEKYSNYSSGSLRKSPEVQYLLRIENYYVKNRDFAMAAAVKREIARHEQYELDRVKLSAQKTIESDMDKVISRQIMEMKIFIDNLETIKNKLKKETAVGLRSIENKVNNERVHLLGAHPRGKILFPQLKLDGSVSGVYNELDSGFNEMEKVLVPQELAIGSKVSPKSLSARGSSKMSFLSSKETKRKVLSQTVSQRNKMINITLNDPRVALAYEKSLRKSEYILESRPIISSMLCYWP